MNQSTTGLLDPPRRARKAMSAPRAVSHSAPQSGAGLGDRVRTALSISLFGLSCIALFFAVGSFTSEPTGLERHLIAPAGIILLALCARVAGISTPSSAR